MEEGKKNVDFLGNYDGADECLEKTELPAGKETSAQALVSSELGGVSGSQKLHMNQSIDRVGAQVISGDAGEEPRGQVEDLSPKDIWLADVGGLGVVGPVDGTLEDLSEDNLLLLELARNFLEKVPKPDCGPKTAREYLKIFNRVARDGTSLKDMRSKSTYYKYRAALQAVGGARLVALLEMVDLGRASADVVDWFRHTMAVLHQAGVLERIPGCPIENPTPKRGKRRSLGIRYWRERMWRRAYRRFTKYCGPLAILHLAGVRPDELEKGVWVSADSDERILTLSIRGAKTSRDGTTGQPWRQVFINCKDADHGSPKYFLEKLVLMNDGVVQVSACAHNLCDFVRRLADQEFGRKRHQISPYSYRHQTAADLKGDTGVSKLEIAAVLGHQSDRTQKNYGSVRQAGGGNGIIAVKSAKRIRQHASPRNFPRTGGRRHKAD
jgi:integrase